MNTISLLGLGAMGSRLGARLLQHDYSVVVYNRTRERAAPLRELGAEVASTPREAAERGDIVISMVRDDDASESVWLSDKTGAIHGLRTKAIAIESSTLTPDWTRRLAALVSERDARFLEAPVVGSRPHAEGGKLTFLVGGDAEALESVRLTLKVLGGAIHHVGPVGSGATMKLAVNSIFAVQAAALAELLATLKGSGLQLPEAVELLNALPTASPAAARVATLMTERSFAPNFPIHLVAKDLGYAGRMAESNHIDAVVLRATHEVFTEAERQGYGADDIVGVRQIHAG